jgi:hypothetical protein
MPGEISRRLKPEEQEMLRKREELAAWVQDVARAGLRK